MDTRDDDLPDPQQPRDQWGGGFQNEYGRVLGRIESTLDTQSHILREMKSEGKGRDKSLKDIEERVRQNAHKANNDLQMVSGRVEGMQVTLNTTKQMVEQVGVQVTGLDKRVGLLEAPVNEAIAARDARRAKWKKWFVWLAAAGMFLWGGFEPIYRLLLPAAVQRWFNILPPH